jgi:hypothetical protein
LPVVLRDLPGVVEGASAVAVVDGVRCKIGGYLGDGEAELVGVESSDVVCEMATR